MTDMRWYLCGVVDAEERPEEPDWSKVPEDRRAMVRGNWLSVQKSVAKVWKMWGPQIEWYNRQPGYQVTVIGPAAPTSDTEAE